ncbi:hypothetical protein I317_05291 [Kwoniella heveanensis CBS 569]|uniref:Enoyl reductase (ER) domain-containing protein n=1 Tax=Kwoniella heveanensis BCC8398 TaxID=1296120 RepID=A0A1B9H2C1_9TREE|nr:hypothetical protein I316_00529 [Kwoniella heveanensis BCC8398]OCF40932.1 hypothetical protein I317_05291 [Kwoniella heveanensis CBS 569]
MSAQTDYKFAGWAGDAPDSIEGKLKWIEYEPKKFAEDDIDIKIQYCGICASDISTLSEGWGPMKDAYPQIVGHEIVGEVVRVGKDTKNGIKMGDIVGVGAQCDSCLKCHYCNKDQENYCSGGMVGTYNGKFSRTSEGSKSWGGYADYWRGPSHFAIPIPEGMDPAEAAPYLCGGGTMYTPLVQHGAGKTAKNIGIIGLGGLGHFGVLLAKSLGCEVTVISHSARKKEDAEKLGASHFLITGDDEAKAFKGHERSLDLIICSSNAPDMNMTAYLSLLRPGGNFILTGVPETGKISDISPFSLIMGNVHIGGSLIASPATLKEMLALVAEKKVHPWIKKWPMDKVNEAVPDMVAGNARYRHVLVNVKNGGKL